MKDQCFPARLHVILPTNSDNALVIRRGPSKQTCILSWNTQSDEVQPTQWLKGRIYERRSDVSPDGKHWIYFAMNGRWNSKNRGSWTAIAKESRFVDGDRESTVAEGDRPFPERRLLARRRAFSGQRFLLVKRWLRPRNTDRDKRVEAGRCGAL